MRTCAGLFVIIRHSDYYEMGRECLYNVLAGRTVSHEDLSLSFASWRAITGDLNEIPPKLNPENTKHFLIS